MAHHKRSSLTVDELAFTVLVSSHQTFCSLLSDVVQRRLRQTYPDTWMDQIVACFSSSVAGHLRNDLEKDGVGHINDAFVLCKVIRSFMRRVFSKPPTKSGQDGIIGPMEVERFAFQLQDVENARHFAFHGQGVSVDEAIRSLLSMKHFIKTFLLINDEDFERSFQGFEQEINDKRDALLQTKEASQSLCLLPLQAVFQALIYRCISSLESEISHLLKSMGQKEYMEKFERPKVTAEISSLLLIIKRESSLSPSTSNLTSFVKSRQTFLLNLQKLAKLFSSGEASIRNKLAHGKHFEHDEVKETLDSTKSLLDSLKTLKDNMVILKLDSSVLLNIFDDIEETEKQLINCEIASNESPCQLSSRAKCLVKRDRCFAGRDSELQSTLETLRKLPQPCLRSPAVQDKLHHVTKTICIGITGIPGVGKSTLARQILHELQADFVRQSWVSSDTASHVKSDLLSSVLSCHQQAMSDNDMRSALDALPDRELIVLDNLRKQSVPLVRKLFSKSKHILIITTYSQRTLQHSLHEGFDLSHQATLCPFHTEDSLKIVKSIVRANFESSTISDKNLEHFWAELAGVLIEDLGNLPLAVSTFGVLLQRSIKARIGKKKTLKVEEAQKALLKIKEEMSSSLERAEQESENSFHVRGLGGVVKMALEEISNHPQALLLVFAGAMTGDIAFPWAFVDIKIESLIVRCPADSAFSSDQITAQFSLFLSVFESLCGEKNRERSSLFGELEDLGLAECSAAGDEMHMHRLIQACVWQNINSDASHVNRLFPCVPEQDGLDLLVTLLFIFVTEAILVVMTDGKEKFRRIKEPEKVHYFSAIKVYQSLHQWVEIESLPSTDRWKVAFVDTSLESEKDKRASLTIGVLQTIQHPDVITQCQLNSLAESQVRCILVEISIALSDFSKEYSSQILKQVLECVGRLPCFPIDDEKNITKACAWYIYTTEGIDKMQGFLAEMAPQINFSDVYQPRLTDSGTRLFLSSEEEYEKLLHVIKSLTWDELAERTEWILQLQSTAFEVMERGDEMQVDLADKVVEVGVALRERLVEDKKQFYGGSVHLPLLTMLLQGIRKEVDRLAFSRLFSKAVHHVDNDETVRDCLRRATLFKGAGHKGVTSQNRNFILSLVGTLCHQAKAASCIGWYEKEVGLLHICWGLICANTTCFSSSVKIFRGNFFDAKLSLQANVLMGKPPSHILQRVLHSVVNDGHFPGVWIVSMKTIFVTVSLLVHDPEPTCNRRLEHTVVEEAMFLLAMTAVLGNCEEYTLMYLSKLCDHKPLSLSSSWKCKMSEVIRNVVDLINSFRSTTGLRNLGCTVALWKKLVAGGSLEQVKNVYHLFLMTYHRCMEYELSCVSTVLGGVPPSACKILLKRVGIKLTYSAVEEFLALGQFQLAEDILGKFISDQTLYAPSHFGVASLHLALANVLHFKGDLDTALLHAKTALQMHKDIFGEKLTDELCKVQEQCRILEHEKAMAKSKQ